jgi:CMP-N-acetylneuraminic acid synthetase
MSINKRGFGRSRVKIFVPIKHNSQRVPGKNFRSLGGEPLYKHTLLKYIDFDLYIDTDSPEILSELSKDKRFSKATVYKREDHLMGDKISVCDLIKNFILKFNISDPIVQLHVTSPFLTPEIITQAYGHMKQYDSVVSCTTHNSRFWRKEHYGFCPINHNPIKLEQTQDLPQLYEENSAFYIFNPDVIINTGNRIGKNPYFYPIENPMNIDIDTEQDWSTVIMTLKSRQNL